MKCGTVALPLGPPPANVGSPYGMRNTRSGPGFHAGLDLHAPEGTPVHAVLPGRVVAVIQSGDLDGYGNTVVLEHAGLFSLSAHLQAFAVAPGAVVPAGALIGYVGRTAGTRADPGKLFERSKPHLHLEFLHRWPPAGRQTGRLDPAPVLRSLGIIVPQQGPLVLRCEPEDLPGTPPSPLERRHTPPLHRRRGGGGALLLAALLWSGQSRK